MKVAFAIGAIVATFVAPSMTQDITSIPQCAVRRIVWWKDIPDTDIYFLTATTDS